MKSNNYKKIADKSKDSMKKQKKKINKKSILWKKV